MQGFWFLLITVGTFSIVQSLFGVGLLVFGTPTLLLAGYSFEDTIASLLPSSLLISLMQVLHGRRYISELRDRVLLYCIPFIAIGLALVLNDMLTLDVRILVGAALMFSAVARLDQRIQGALASLLKRYTPFYLMAMGFLHGISNMGGGFLTIFVGTLYSDKEKTRANIAFGYFVFAASQIAVLLVFQPQTLGLQSLGLAAVAFAAYQTIGNFIFLKSSRSVYQRLITAFMIAYGVLLIGQELF
jgi:uncharacterized membrane protein YfcA